MKKILALILMLTIAFVVSTPTHKQYSVPNALYNNGEIITPLDQNIWGWEDDTLPNNTVVTITFDDNGTTDYIYDDIILDVVAQ